MRLPTTLPYPNDDKRVPALLRESIERTNAQVNMLAEGFVHASHGARTSYPTTGTWAQGDYIRCSTPTEAGSASSKYVVLGWIRVTSGADNALNTDWLECRALTGN